MEPGLSTSQSVAFVVKMHLHSKYPNKLIIKICIIVVMQGFGEMSMFTFVEVRPTDFHISCKWSVGVRKTLSNSLNLHYCMMQQLILGSIPSIFSCSFEMILLRCYGTINGRRIVVKKILQNPYPNFIKTVFFYLTNSLLMLLKVFSIGFRSVDLDGISSTSAPNLCNTCCFYEVLGQ